MCVEAAILGDARCYIYNNICFSSQEGWGGKWWVGRGSIVLACRGARLFFIFVWAPNKNRYVDTEYFTRIFCFGRRYCLDKDVKNSTVLIVGVFFAFFAASCQY